MTLNLQALSQAGQQAFEICLHESLPLQVEAIVRRVPKKRLVCRGVWNNQAVYAKIFIGGDAKKYALRDKRGIDCLTKAEIATPVLLYAGLAEGGEAEVLIYQAIRNCENVEVVYKRELNQATRFALATKIVTEVAKHHNANLLQTDLYLKNFLIKNDTVYTLDGDGVRQYAKINQRQALENVSILLSKFDVLAIEIWLTDLLKAYAQARAWQFVLDAALIKKMTNAHRQQVASNYADKKVFRQCSDVNVVRQNSLFTCLSSQYPQNFFPEILTKLDVCFTVQNLLKSGNTCTVALVEIARKKLVIKRYNIKSFWHGVSRALRQTRAAASWANAYRLKILDIATAAPIALIETRHLLLGKYGVKGRAYFLAEYIDAPDAAQFFAECAEKTARAEAVKNISTLFYKLYLLKISHGDMKATNIKIVDKQPVLIDLDSMIQHGFDRLALNGHARDLRRFMQNWQDSPALYNAFVKAFKAIYADDAPLKLAKLIE